MTILAVLIISCLGFSCMAFAKPKHWKAIPFLSRLRHPGKRIQELMQYTGTILLILAVYTCQLNWGWALGLCFYAGALSIALFFVSLVISYFENTVKN